MNSVMRQADCIAIFKITFHFPLIIRPYVVEGLGKTLQRELNET